MLARCCLRLLLALYHHSWIHYCAAVARHHRHLTLLSLPNRRSALRPHHVHALMSSRSHGYTVAETAHHRRVTRLHGHRIAASAPSATAAFAAFHFSDGVMHK